VHRETSLERSIAIDGDKVLNLIGGGVTATTTVTMLDAVKEVAQSIWS
jgi:hypothetical protein